MEELEHRAALLKKLRRLEERFDFLLRHVCDDFIEINVQTGECRVMHADSSVPETKSYEDQVAWVAENLIVEEEREAYRAEFTLRQFLARLQKHGGFCRSVYSVHCSGGRRFWHIVSALFRDSLHPEEEYIFSYAQDITELKRHEEQNRQLIDISQQLLSVSQHDALTELYNRAAAEKAIEDHLLRGGTAMRGTLLLMDIDRFKQINDCYGHDAGDQVLRYLAGAMRDVFRSDDILCRWGGDEFLVFMRNLDDAVIVASRMERLRCKMAEFAPGLEGRSVTLSAGIVTANAGSTLSELFKQADEVLYRVKNGGRNNFLIERSE